MNDAEIFDRVTKERGRFHGFLDRSKLHALNSPNALKDLINEFARRVLSKLPNIHFLISYATLGLTAFNENGRYFIGLYTGTIFMLRMVISDACLSDPQLFLKIGDRRRKLLTWRRYPEYSTKKRRLRWSKMRF